ncbi:MAG TPA: hypothetical protein VK186_02800 [Candidatus Deferrimicrobium sp.]|nr:hypothetical protein [Candidatus Deferrimicrobium sp.]
MAQPKSFPPQAFKTPRRAPSQRLSFDFLPGTGPHDYRHDGYALLPAAL